MNKKILIFAGTLEGRLMAEFLATKGVITKVCLATEYGESLFPPNPNFDLFPTRLNQEEMETLIQDFSPQIVVDATHPYAKIVTENIKNATTNTNVPYLRLLRPSSHVDQDNFVVVANVQEAVDYLKTTTGNIFLTTGSKELHSFTAIPDYKNRVFARVLSLPSVMADVADLGFTGKNLICMQGPFSYELNVEMLKQCKADFLVTKESGDVGGFEQKILAANAIGAKIVIIGRPLKESGLDFDTCKQQLSALFNLRQEISIVGIGMGNPNTLTIEAKLEIDSADVLIGAKRMVDSVKSNRHHVFYAYKSEEIVDFIQNNPQLNKVVIVQSGDVGFFSGTKKLVDKLPKDTKLFSGIASPVYLCSKLKLPWNDVIMTSLHGVQSNIVAYVQNNEKVFTLLSDGDSVRQLCKKLCHFGLVDVEIVVGENLSYPDEKITTITSSQGVDLKTLPLSVALIINKGWKKHTMGIADDAFLRDKVPMTKHDIRVLSLARLQLSDHSVAVDIGAGTGSISIEMAKLCWNGKVFAIEKKEQAVHLIHKNKEKFATDNLEIINGLAPDALVTVPPLTHAFIGGSSGNLKEIITALFENNPTMRVVVNAITLETLAETLEITKTFPVCNVDIASISSARSEKLGSYNLMRGQNPVYIISFDGVMP